jgi:hypothetical protein
MNVNGSLYYADDISKDTVVQNPGYAYFLNGSVTFDGVKFETICPSTYSGCPTPTGTAVQNQMTVMAGAVKMNVTFPDRSTETIGEVFGDSTYAFVLSQHTNPRAGLVIEYVTYNYPNNFPPYHAFLLVSPQPVLLRSVENFGPQISLDQAKTYLGLNFTLPNALPDGLAVEEIRGVPNSIVIVYSSPTVSVLPDWNEGSMFITIARDNTTYSPASGPVQGGSEVISCGTGSQSTSCTTTDVTLWTGNQTVVENVLVSGHPGLALSPKVSPQAATPYVTWWVGGVHYTILGDIPVAFLLVIAQSMST